MPDRDSFRKSLRVIKWLGYNTLEEHPLARMLHEARAAETAREKLIPANKRRGYQFRPQRVYAAGDLPEATAAPIPPLESPQDEPWKNRPSMVATRYYDTPQPAPPTGPASGISPEAVPEPVDHLFEMRMEHALEDPIEDASGRN
jgi:hypothetical protein